MWDRELLYSGGSDMRILVWGSFNKTNLLDFADFAQLRTLLGHEHSVSRVLLVPGRDMLLSCSRDKTIKLWDKNTGYGIKTIEGIHEDWIRCMDANKKFLVSSGNDKKIFVFDLPKVLATEGKDAHDSFQMVNDYFEVHDNYVEAIRLLQSTTFSGEANVAFTASRDKTIGAWDVVKGTCLSLFKGHESWVKDICLLEEHGFLISVGEDKTIRVWDLKKRKMVFMETNAHEHFINCLDYHSEFRVLATGSVDKTCKLWKLSNSLTAQDLV